MCVLDQVVALNWYPTIFIKISEQDTTFKIKITKFEIPQNKLYGQKGRKMHKKKWAFKWYSTNYFVITNSDT